jgi:TPR repeat protein
MVLVFRRKKPKVISVDQTLFGRLFNRPPPPALPESTERQAECGSPDAQFHLGMKYASGEGPAQDYGQAARWYLKAAEQDHVLAQFNLGIMFASGQGVSRNDSEAEMWFGKAAQHGDPGAQHKLGMSRYRASMWGPPQNMPEARIEAYTWLVLAAAQGYGEANAASATVALKMTREEVAEATRRVAGFTPSLSSQPASL